MIWAGIGCFVSGACWGLWIGYVAGKKRGYKDGTDAGMIERAQSRAAARQGGKS